MQTKQNLEDLPYERFWSLGAEHLSEKELLAIILRSGTKEKDALTLAKEILAMSDTRKGLRGLFHLSIEDLLSIRGIGEVKAVQIMCLGEICKRMTKPIEGTNISFTDPDAVARHYMPNLAHLEWECVYLMCLDNKGRLLREKQISHGSIRMSLIPPREIFLEALQSKAVNIILIHNHPSGDPSPSQTDIESTIKIKRLGEDLQIPLLDHIIIGDYRYYSFRKEDNVFLG